MKYEYFSEEELSCNCGSCDSSSESMDRAFMGKLTAMREELGFQMPVTSAHRCPAYNAKVSSTGHNGPHTTGRAVDIRVSRNQAYEIVTQAKRFGFTGVGVAQRGTGRFVHLDDLDEGYPRPTVWSY